MVEPLNQDQNIRDSIRDLISRPNIENTKLVLSLKAQLLSEVQLKQIGILNKNNVPAKVIAETVECDPRVVEFLI